jgi:hypothetical protein
VAGVGQAMNAGGHAKADMSLEYTLTDLTEQNHAIRAFQARILGNSSASEDGQNGAGNKTEQDKLFDLPGLDIPDELPKMVKELILDGGLEKTRTSDLFRVKEAL